MGDFERTFGAGANIESIMDGYSRDYKREQRGAYRAEPKSKTFSSFSEAAAWAKSNPGKIIVRVPGTDEFMVKT